jgi:tRNA pseudouridine55 synthase
VSAGAPEGLLVVDKPTGLTSHDVVARVRRLAGTRRVGHAGTLDPLATGVLVLGVGRATRLLGHLALRDKEYLATIRLGVSTVTDDAQGEVLRERDASTVSDAALLEAMRRLSGELTQIPSAVSAIKIDGVRSYARVRSGEQVVLAGRPVTVSRFALLRRRGDDVEVSVCCSTGTYVRALARDLGEALDVGAHLTALRRTRVGPYRLTQASTLPELAELTPDRLPIIGLAEAVGASFPRRELEPDETREIRYGRRLPPTGVSGVHGAFASTGELLALIEDRDGAARPLVVFAPATTAN